MRIPVATDRLQFGPSLRFQDAKAPIPYLSDLGISDVHASPILKQRCGDVLAPDRNDEYGRTRALSCHPTPPVLDTMR